jgi:hypothetical protein
MSQSTTPPIQDEDELPDHEVPIAKALNRHRDSIEAIAASDTSFSPAAQRALTWLNNRTKPDTQRPHAPSRE